MSEQSAIDDLVDIHVVAAGQEAQRLFRALRRAYQSLAAGIFPQIRQDFSHVRRDR